ncbi:MAG: pseudaminic acid cytidylyltransferase [Bacteroidales bacterium]
MRNLAIIPARGGSKRIPHKNIKFFMGKPIVAYSIETAINSGLFDKVMVSTDDDEIAEVAKKYGADVPFLRSKETANDYATLNDVIKEVINTYKEQGIEYDNVCCILATAPLITPDLLNFGYDKLLSSNLYSTVYPIVAFSYPIQRCLQINAEGTMSMKWPEYSRSRSQDLEKLYHDTGTFYWHKVKLWMSGNIKKTAIILNDLQVQDIDTEVDWKLAELKYSLLNDNK